MYPDALGVVNRSEEIRSSGFCSCPVSRARLTRVNRSETILPSASFKGRPKLRRFLPLFLSFTYRAGCRSGYASPNS